MDKPAAARRSGLPTGIEIREGKNGPRIRVTFVWQGARRRETLGIPATQANIKYAANLRAAVHNAIERGQFDYAEFFPASKVAATKPQEVQVRPTIKQLLDDYLNTARKSKSLSPSTIASYASWANGRLGKKWGDRVAEDIKTAELRAWIAELVAEIDTKSIRNCVGLLSAVLSRALSDSTISVNPLEPIKLNSVLPKRKAAPEASVDPFNDDEINAILSACRSIEERALWQFAFSSGLRTGELIALKVRNIDLANGSIRVEDNIVSGEIGTTEKDTKTRHGRDIPILPGAREAISLVLAPSRAPNEYLFINPRTNKRWLDDQQMRETSWRSLLALAKVRYRYPYQTRHTFASRLLMAGEQELLVAKLLGHASVEMVRRSYGRYIKQTGGIVLRGNYSAFGANLGQINAPNNLDNPRKDKPE